MKKCLLMVAVCLMAAPAIGDEVSEPTLSSLGLDDMEVLNDSDGMQVRGLSSNAAAGGGSLTFGQLSYIDQFGQNFFVASDINTNRATSQNAGLNAFSNANTAQGSAVNGALIVAPSMTTPGFNGAFSGLAGLAFSATGGMGNTFAN